VLGYQDGSYISYVTPTPAGHDLAADPLDRTPKWTGTLSGNYVFTVFNRAHITIDSDVEYTDKQLYTESIGPEDQNTYLNAHTLVNASIQLSDLDDRKYIRLIGQNLGDRIYTTATQIVGGLWSDAMYGPPRYFGVQMGVKFGG
jgi:iron complex outermembrane receptor protein